MARPLWRTEAAVAEQSSAPKSGDAAEPSVEKRALIDAYENALRHTAPAVEDSGAPGRRLPTALMLGLLVAAAGTLVLVNRPAWLFPPPPLAEAPALQQASTRVALFVAARHVAQYRTRTGHLPASLHELNATVPRGIMYAVVDTAFTLTMSAAGATIVLHSGDSMREFLGGSYRALRERQAH